MYFVIGNDNDIRAIMRDTGMSSRKFRKIETTADLRGVAQYNNQLIIIKGRDLGKEEIDVIEDSIRRNTPIKVADLSVSPIEFMDWKK